MAAHLFVMPLRCTLLINNHINITGPSNFLLNCPRSVSGILYYREKKVCRVTSGNFPRILSLLSAELKASTILGRKIVVSGHTFDDNVNIRGYIEGLVVNKGENPHKLIFGGIILVLSWVYVLVTFKTLYVTHLAIGDKCNWNISLQNVAWLLNRFSTVTHQFPIGRSQRPHKLAACRAQRYSLCIC